MKRSFLPRVLPLLLVVRLALMFTPVAHAAAPPATPNAAAPDTKVGVIAAVLCGFGLRMLPVVAGGGAVAIAGEVSVCTLALLDGLMSQD